MGRTVRFLPLKSHSRVRMERVVVKKMLSDDVLDKKTFIKEARILQRLEHPNIVDFSRVSAIIHLPLC